MSIKKNQVYRPVYFSQLNDLRRQRREIQKEINRVTKILEYQTTDDGRAAWQCEVDKFEKQKAEIMRQFNLTLDLERAARSGNGR